MQPVMRTITGYVAFAVVAFLGGAAANLITAPPSATAADPPGFAKMIVARKFAVLDEKGNSRIVLGCGNLKGGKKYPGIWLYDEKGKIRVSIGLAPGGAPMIGLVDQKGMPRVMLSVLGVGAGLKFFAKDGKTETMSLSTDVYDKIGEVTVLKMLHSKTGKNAVGLVGGVDQGGGLVLYDKSGEPVWSAP